MNFRFFLLLSFVFALNSKFSFADFDESYNQAINNNYSQNSYQDYSRNNSPRSQSNYSSGNFNNQNNYDQSSEVNNDYQPQRPVNRSNSKCPFFSQQKNPIHFYYSMGTSSFAVRLALNYLGINYIPHSVDLKNHLLTEGSRETNYYEINPKGAVPYITQGNFQLSECPIILYSLADKCGDLIFEGSLRYKVLEMLNFIATDIYREVTPLFNNALNTQSKKEFERILRKNLDVLDKSLQGKLYLVGNKITIADIYLYSILLILQITPISIDEYSNINQFFKNISSLPFVSESLRQEIEENKK